MGIIRGSAIKTDLVRYGEIIRKMKLAEALSVRADLQKNGARLEETSRQ